MQDPLNPYKLIVMYMLHRVEFPLTRVQLFDFVLDHGYTTFFALQQSIAELIDAGLVSAKASHNSTLLSLTEQGVTTLSYFENRVHDDIKREIDEYFNENKMDMKNELSIRCDYYKSTRGDYIAHLYVNDGKETPIDLSLSMPTEEMAILACDNWKKSNQEIYAYIMKKLL